MRSLERLLRSARTQSELLRFGVVGTIGFCIDAGILLLLSSSLAWSPIVARTISFPVAVSVTWYINRNWTFQQGRSRTAREQYGGYFAIQLIGLAINFSIFALLATDVFWFRERPTLALAIAAIVSFAFTYGLSKRTVFRLHPNDIRD